jgi:hypothetical protein
MTTRHVKILIELDVDEEIITDMCTEDDFDHALERMRSNIQHDVKIDWPGENFKVTADYDRDPEPKPSKTPGHLINLVKISLTNQNDLSGRMPKCSCGAWWGVDGYQGKKPFRSEALAQRIGDVHLYHVEHGIITETA